MFNKTKIKVIQTLSNPNSRTALLFVVGLILALGFGIGDDHSG